MELTEFAGDAEVAFALGQARGLGVLEEFERGLEGAEESLLDEGAVKQGLGLEVASLESVVGGSGFVAAEAVEAPLDFGESPDVIGFGFANRRVVLAEASEESIEFFLTFAGKDDGFGKRSVFQGVLGGACLAFS